MWETLVNNVAFQKHLAFKEKELSNILSKVNQNYISDLKDKLYKKLETLGRAPFKKIVEIDPSNAYFKGLAVFGNGELTYNVNTYSDSLKLFDFVVVNKYSYEMYKKSERTSLEYEYSFLDKKKINKKIKLSTGEYYFIFENSKNNTPIKLNIKIQRE